MPSWQDKVSKHKPTRVSRNGQIVLPVRARREAGIEPGDLVVSVPVSPGVLLVEKVPDAWVDEIRSQWNERRSS